MFNVRLYGEMAVYLVAAGDVFDSISFCAVLFSHEMSRIRSGAELSQFLRFFLPSLLYFVLQNC